MPARLMRPAMVRLLLARACAGRTQEAAGAPSDVRLVCSSQLSAATSTLPDATLDSAGATARLLPDATSQARTRGTWATTVRRPSRASVRMVSHVHNLSSLLDGDGSDRAHRRAKPRPQHADRPARPDFFPTQPHVGPAATSDTFSLAVDPVASWPCRQRQMRPRGRQSRSRNTASWRAHDRHHLPVAGR